MSPMFGCQRMYETKLATCGTQAVGSHNTSSHFAKIHICSLTYILSGGNIFNHCGWSDIFVAEKKNPHRLSNCRKAADVSGSGQLVLVKQLLLSMTSEKIRKLVQKDLFTLIHLWSKKKFPDESVCLQMRPKSAVNMKVAAVQLWSMTPACERDEKGRFSHGNKAKTPSGHIFPLTSWHWRQNSRKFRKKHIFTKKECHTTGPQSGNWKYSQQSRNSVTKTFATKMCFSCCSLTKKVVWSFRLSKFNIAGHSQGKHPWSLELERRWWSNIGLTIWKCSKNIGPLHGKNVLTNNMSSRHSVSRNSYFILFSKQTDWCWQHMDFVQLQHSTSSIAEDTSQKLTPHLKQAKKISVSKKTNMWTNRHTKIGNLEVVSLTTCQLNFILSARYEKHGLSAD